MESIVTQHNPLQVEQQLLHPGPRAVGTAPQPQQAKIPLPGQLSPQVEAGELGAIHPQRTAAQAGPDIDGGAPGLQRDGTRRTGALAQTQPVEHQLRTEAAPTRLNCAGLQVHRQLLAQSRQQRRLVTADHA